MGNNEYISIANFISKEQPKKADDCVFNLGKEIENALVDISWWFDLPDEEAYKNRPNLSINLHRTDDPMFAFPGHIGIAVLFFTNITLHNPFLLEHKQMYIDGYLAGWENFQSFSERSVRFGTQPIQDRKKALFNRFVEYRTKHKEKGFSATLLKQMGQDAGFMFALAKELCEIDAIIPISQDSPKKKSIPSIPFCEYLLVDDKLDIIRKLQGLPFGLGPKMYGAIITVMIEKGIMRPIADGERGTIYKALDNLYTDGRDIGSRQGVSAHICERPLSDLDRASAEEFLR